MLNSRWLSKVLLLCKGHRLGLPAEAEGGGKVAAYCSLAQRRRNRHVAANNENILNDVIKSLKQ